MEINKIYNGNCTEVLKKVDSNIVDLVYFDPPFFTQKKHKLTNKDNSRTYEFDDKYSSLDEYLRIIENVLSKLQADKIYEDFMYNLIDEKYQL